jgi:hypothetical protein
MTKTSELKFQLKVLTAQGSWVNYGRPHDRLECDAIRLVSTGIEGQHYRFEAV